MRQSATKRIAHIKSHLDIGFDVPTCVRNIEKRLGSPSACVLELSSHALASAMYEWFQNRNLGLTRQWCHVAGKLDRMYDEMEPSTAGPGAKLLQLLRPLVSNDVSLIRWFAQNDQAFDSDVENHHTIDFWAYQAIVALRGDWDRLIARCERILSDPPTDSHGQKYVVDHQFHLALARGDRVKMQDALPQIMTPKLMQARSDDESGFTEDLICTSAVIYAKIAWYHGYRIEIDSPYIPAEWLPMEPLERYDHKYSFLR